MGSCCSKDDMNTSSLTQNPNSAHGSQPTRIVIIGGPAAGKGTQASRLSKHFQISHFSSGDAIREEIRSGSELGKRIHEYSSSGRLLPDELLVEVLDRHLKGNTKGWILDGVPRTKSQVQLLSTRGYVPDFIVKIEVPDEIMVGRVSGRRSDPVTGEAYHLEYNPPPKGEIADRCIQREDDNEVTVKERIKTFRAETAGILEQYSDDTILEVDGTKKPDQIFEEILQKIDQKKMKQSSGS